MTRRRMLDELTAIIGYPATARLIRAFGGRRLYIPATLDDEHPITWVVGHTNAGILATQYSGEYLDLPDEQLVVLDLRNRRMAAEYRSGHSVRQLARTYALSPSGVRKILVRLGLRGEASGQVPPEQPAARDSKWAD